MNEHMVYYWDLVPVINMNRVINHLVSVIPEMATISVNHFLQPTAQTSHPILLLLFNLMVFNEQRLRDIAPYEEELFNVTDMVSHDIMNFLELLETFIIQASNLQLINACIWVLSTPVFSLKGIHMSSFFYIN